MLAPLILIVTCLAIILLFALLARYAHPSSDDFCMASGVNAHGLLRHLWDHYFEWSGRYTGNALYAVYPLIFGLFEGYKFIAGFVLLALFFATAFFLSRMFSISMYARPVLLSSLFFVCAFLLGMMSPASGLYWMAGAFTYQTANVLFLVIMGLMIQLADYQKQSKNYLTLLSVLLVMMVIAVGTNETSMLALTGISLAGAVVHLRSGWLILKPWLLILVVTLVCFAIVYFSPGNAIRAADFPLRHDILRSINGSLSVGLKVLWLWISNPVLIVSSLLLPFAVSGMFRLSVRQISGSSFMVSNVMIAALLLNTFTMPVILQFPAWWSMGGWPPARTLDVIYFLFIVSWYLSITAVTLRYLGAEKWKLIKQPYGSGGTAVLLLLTVLFTVAAVESKAFQLAKADLFVHAKPYHEYLNARYRQIEHARENAHDSLMVADYQQVLPRSIFFNDIMHNPAHWRNACYADYFELEKIRRFKQRSNID